MESSLPPNEPYIRLAVFLGVFVLMAVLEAAFPRRARRHARLRRWPANLGIAAINPLAVRLTFPIVGVGMAALAADRGWGLFNVAAAPAFAAFILSFLILDLAIWAQHVLFHKVPLFWRFHRMHHADLDLDATSGLRFHTGEILLSMLIKLGVIAALGAPAAAVLAFEVVLNATSMFNHANLRLPRRLDGWLRLILVTPDMHRVHHSVRREETGSNFGFNLPWWDRLFGTYRAQPEGGHAAMTIGLQEFRDPRELRLDRMLAQPFKTTTPTASL